jgi:hypothetical protein
MLHLRAQHGILMNIQPVMLKTGLPGAGDRPFLFESAAAQ